MGWQATQATRRPNSGIRGPASVPEYVAPSTARTQRDIASRELPEKFLNARPSTIRSAATSDERRLAQSRQFVGHALVLQADHPGSKRVRVHAGFGVKN